MPIPAQHAGQPNIARPLAPLFLVLTGIGLAFSSVGEVQAQVGSAPQRDYYSALSIYYSGEYRTAGAAFRNVASGGIRNIDGRWIDSICYHTMVGESFYQLGDYPHAVEQYENALRLFMAHSGWMLKVKWPDSISAANNASLRRISWGPSQRRTTIGNFPDTLLCQLGRVDNQNVIKQGGVVDEVRLQPVGVMEVMRCTAIAIQRRGELLGPTAPQSTLTAQVAATLMQPLAPANHWSTPLVGVQLGLAYSATGQKTQAINALQGSLQVAGQYDHPLTGIALLELGRIALEQDRLDAAAVFFFEATFAGAAFDQPDVVDEAFRLGTAVHMIMGKPNVYPPLAPAMAWAKSQRYTQLEASLAITAAENFAHIGDLKRAAGLLNDATRNLRRSDMATGLTGARFQYQLALLNYQNGNAAVGDTALAALMAFQTKGSQRLFQIAVADALYLSDTITPRDSIDLFATVLREPTPHDWALDPMESLSVTTIPHLLPMEHWFEAVMTRPDNSDAIRIADLVRRHRFYSTLPMGGRLLSLRWTMAAPKTQLTNDDLLRRQDILTRYPAYAKLTEQAEATALELAKLPLDVTDAKQLAAQRKLLEQMGGIAISQELFLRALALRREPARFIFPPVGDLPEVQKQLPEGRLVLSFFATSRYVFAFLFTHDQFTHWQVEQAPQVATKVKQLLEAMGQRDPNLPLSAEQLTNTEWQRPARETLTMLMNSSRGDFWDNYEELIVVPDGVVWHIPFAALHATNEGAEKPAAGGQPLASFPLIDKVRVRTIPTVGCISSVTNAHQEWPTTAFVLGSLYPRDDPSVALNAYDDLRPTVSTSVAIVNEPPATSSLFNSRYDRLVVWEDLEDSRQNPVGFAPLQLDSGKPGSRLSDWLMLPFNTPREVILPGFHTVAEEALGKSPNISGNELFLTVCSLMAGGNQTALLSRWRTGGQNNLDLIREYLQTSSQTAPSSAWRRSILLGRENEVDPTREPRVTGIAQDSTLQANHPFFWAGYLLVDLRGDEAAE